MNIGLNVSQNDLMNIIMNMDSMLNDATRLLNNKRYNEYLNYIDDNNLDLIIKHFNYQRDKSLQYNLLLYCILTERYEILDFFLDNGCDINSYDVNNNIIYGIVKHNGTLTMIEHAMLRGALITPIIELYHPIITCLSSNNVEYMNIITFIFEQSDFQLNKIYSIYNETLLIIAIKYKFFDIARLIIDKYKQLYPDDLYNYINHRSLINSNALDVAAFSGSYDIIRLLLNNSAEIPTNRILYKTNGIIRIYSYWSINKCKNVYFLINKKITLNEFIQLIMVKPCNDFLKWNVDLLNDLYKLPYNHELILRAINKCCIDSMSHDIDSVSYLCKKLFESHCATKIQNVVRKYLMQIRFDNIRYYTMKIQAWYRHKYYLPTLNKENCSICLELLAEDECYKFTCGHFCHINCFTQWRKEKNICPCCRKLVILPLKCSA